MKTLILAVYELVINMRVNFIGNAHQLAIYTVYRTPSVNQYWEIVNASLPCNIFCSLCRLKFAPFKRILTAQKAKFRGAEMRTNVLGAGDCGFDIHAELYFCTWPKSDHCKIRQNASLTAQKNDMN